MAKKNINNENEKNNKNNNINENENEQIRFDDTAVEPETTKAEVSKVSKKGDKADKKKKVVKKVKATKKLDDTSLTAAIQKKVEEEVNPEDIKGNPLFNVPKKVTDWEEVVKDINITTDIEMRALIKQFYNVYQSRRIQVQNQNRSIMQGFSNNEASDIIDDNDLEEMSDLIKFPALAVLADMQLEQEKALKGIIERYVLSKPMGQYLTSIVGVGPLLAGSLMGYLKPTLYSGEWISYAGLNNNNDPWIKGDTISYLFDKYKVPKIVTPEIIGKISAETGRAANRIIEGASSIDAEGNSVILKKDLEAYLKKPNHNRELKKVIWKLGESLNKIRNKPNSLYGKLLAERQAEENANNEKHYYIQEAIISLGWRPADKPKGWVYKKNPNLTLAEEEELLKQVQYDIDNKIFTDFNKISPSAETFELYYNGYLNKAHILNRAKRWAAKIFLSHIHDAMYIDEKGELPPVPYVFTHGGHCRYIEPEVPFSKIWSWVDDEELKRRALEAAANTTDKRVAKSDNPTTCWM